MCNDLVNLRRDWESLAMTGIDGQVRRRHRVHSLIMFDFLHETYYYVNSLRKTENGGEGEHCSLVNQDPSYLFEASLSIYLNNKYLCFPIYLVLKFDFLFYDNDIII